MLSLGAHLVYEAGGLGFLDILQLAVSALETGAVCSRQHLKREYMMMFVSQEVDANYFGIS